MYNKTFILIFLAGVFVVGAILYINNPEPVEYTSPNAEEPTICTQDAMLCPDGSSVGREGPDCNFKSCPIPPSAIMEDGTMPE